MEISTKVFGKVNILEEDIITFENGIIGFEDLRKFVLLGSLDADEILVWLQAVEDEKLAFVVIQPRFFNSDYRPEIKTEEVEDLHAEDQAELLLYAIVTVPDDARKMTANLKAPVIINVKNNLAKQIVLNDDRYLIKEPILAEK